MFCIYGLLFTLFWSLDYFIIIKLCSWNDFLKSNSRFFSRCPSEWTHGINVHGTEDKRNHCVCCVFRVKRGMQDWWVYQDWEDHQGKRCSTSLICCKQVCSCINKETTTFYSRLWWSPDVYLVLFLLYCLRVCLVTKEKRYVQNHLPLCKFLRNITNKTL